MGKIKKFVRQNFKLKIICAKNAFDCHYSEKIKEHCICFIYAYYRLTIC